LNWYHSVLAEVRPGQRNPRTGVFGSGGGPYNETVSSAGRGRTTGDAKGRRGVRDGGGLLRMEVLKMEAVIGLKDFTERSRVGSGEQE